MANAAHRYQGIGNVLHEEVTRNNNKLRKNGKTVKKLDAETTIVTICWELPGQTVEDMAVYETIGTLTRRISKHLNIDAAKFIEMIKKKGLKQKTHCVLFQYYSTGKDHELCFINNKGSNQNPQNYVMLAICSNCGAAEKSHPSCCDIARYCSQQCQKNDWSQHKQECNIKEVNKRRAARKEKRKEQTGQNK